ncbi:uncharacterized protein LACBIDRAFT_304179 [Laccaria bicolor S238N-H82]|uniref:Predicted protein n=1 Tax=Laccaria bicolor (strain S238N-H82 / ATCC MYA-4686) TaxID=486041 RepID=B0DL47_LACBS|nr:uncharacterized protein LACBIDRAFT_304179 [Laccaria bicolor S238N-H82]EDR04845.1 predicted protein [Laccaria bicolor S238N-H82]|eukprot:XP_001884669.1 predicted protein [Laccaria bicolor S238N-H82]
MRFRIYCRRHFPTNRRTAALKLIRETMKSEKEQLDKMFGVRDWCILLHDGPHNSDRRPRAYGRSEGDHWSLWGYAFGLKRSTFYMHVYADQSATFGPDTRKVFFRHLCHLLGSGEVGIIRFFPPFSRLTFKSRYPTAANLESRSSTSSFVPICE